MLIIRSWDTVLVHVYEHTELIRHQKIAQAFLADMPAKLANEFKFAGMLAI